MSGAVDEDTRRAVAEGRATLGSVLSAAQGHLQKAFVVFALGVVLTIWGLRAFVWDRLQADLFARMGPEVRESTEVIAITPFDVILLQIKIGLVVGVLLAVPVVLFYSRHAIRERDWWSAGRLSGWQLSFIVAMSLLLFAGGVAYAYVLFFPLMFDFLASNAIQAGFQPTYSIVKWAQFIFLLALSFGLAAQLPLTMSALAYGEVVSYETFRDKWKHAIVLLYAGGALFTPPDPLTQLMWATPLVGLYAFSLRLTKLVVVAKRSSERIDVGAVARGRWNHLAGSALVGFALVYGFLTAGGIGAVNAGLRRLPAAYRPDPLSPLGPVLGIPPEGVAALLGIAAGSTVAGIVLLRFLSAELEATEPAGPAPASAGDPAAIDLDGLDAAAVRAAPPEAFADMGEEAALAHASAAMDADDPEKAQAILDRFDEVVEGADAEDAAAEAAEQEAEESGVLSRTTAGMVDAFTEDETTEDDIGGYYYDLAFILESLTSKAFRIVGVFLLVLGSTFVFLYQGGIGRIKRDFLARMPAEMVGQVDVVALHPVEALIFEIKFSTLLAAIVVLPLVLYYAWPALEERGLAGGNRNVLLTWGLTLVGGLAVGSYLGYTMVAPAIISWLATDAISSHMVIAYRINNFGWLVIFTTVGIGLLAEIPVTMFMFHRGRLVTFRTMRRTWRGIVFGTFAVAGVFTPGGVFTMLLLAVPASLAYGVGLVILWVYTLGGRRSPPRRREHGAD